MLREIKLNIVVRAPSQESPEGAVAPPAAELVDSEGSRWSLGAPREDGSGESEVVVDGKALLVDVRTGETYSASRLLYHDGMVFSKSATPRWRADGEPNWLMWWAHPPRKFSASRLFDWMVPAWAGPDAELIAT